MTTIIQYISNFDPALIFFAFAPLFIGFFVDRITTETLKYNYVRFAFVRAHKRSIFSNPRDIARIFSISFLGRIGKDAFIVRSFFFSILSIVSLFVFEAFLLGRTTVAIDFLKSASQYPIAFAIVVLFAIIADMASFYQTLLFIRIAAEQNHVVHSILIFAADVSISINLWIVIFASGAFLSVLLLDLSSRAVEFRLSTIPVSMHQWDEITARYPVSRNLEGTRIATLRSDDVARFAGSSGDVLVFYKTPDDSTNSVEALRLLIEKSLSTIATSSVSDRYSIINPISFDVKTTAGRVIYIHDAFGFLRSILDSVNFYRFVDAPFQGAYTHQSMLVVKFLINKHNNDPREMALLCDGRFQLISSEYDKTIGQCRDYVYFFTHNLSLAVDIAKYRADRGLIIPFFPFVLSTLSATIFFYFFVCAIPFFRIIVRSTSYAVIAKLINVKYIFSITGAYVSLLLFVPTYLLYRMLL